MSRTCDKLQLILYTQNPILTLVETFLSFQSLNKIRDVELHPELNTGQSAQLGDVNVERTEPRNLLRASLRSSGVSLTRSESCSEAFAISDSATCLEIGSFT